ncbi:MAG: 1-phosphofructokinase [Clostridiales bacterium]|jgi:1-phosphofructokinase|nr:1-phosphofructokinase [Clostridiales bacterium]
MIYTVTFNPSLDHTIWVDPFTLGLVNRTTKELLYPGGKGINVSVVLHNLGLDSIALGFQAGFTGMALEKMLKEYGCQTQLIAIPGRTRINVKIKGKLETDINGQGPAIPQEAQTLLFQRLDALEKGDVLVLAGSVPNTLPQDIYQRIMKRLEGKGILIAVDATGDLLFNVLEYHPFLIKPNHIELGELFGKELRAPEEIVKHAKLLQQKGAQNVLISMGKDGGILVTENGTVYQSPAPDGKPVNAVGAGDSMVAGFLYGYLTKGSYAEAFRMGLCAGSATAFHHWLATKEEIEQVASAFSLSIME